MFIKKFEFWFVSIKFIKKSASSLVFSIHSNKFALNCKIFILIDIIKEIREVLIHPDDEMPSRLDILNTFKNDHDEYEKLARKSAEDNAKNDYRDFIKSTVDDSVLDGFSPTFDKNDIF